MKKLWIIGTSLIFMTQCGNKVNEHEAVQKQMTEKNISPDSLHSYATQTKKFLMKNVGEQMQKGGPESALEFCNIEAMPLTKSMSDRYGLEIYRVSDKNRNPKNTASPEELQLIEKYKKELLAGETLKPVRTETHYYEPLVTNAMCLQCHGEPGKNIKPKVAEKIAELYPNDRATGYKENEVRGLIIIKTK